MKPAYLEIRVECYAGCRGEEEPRRFGFQQDRIEVTEILDRWLDPNHRYFKVRGADGGLYLLRHDPIVGSWGLRILSVERWLDREDGPG